MKERILMRVLFCKVHCPFICFCKPSSATHLYTSGPLKLENSPQAAPSSSSVVSVSDTPDDQISGETSQIKEEGLVVNGEQGKENVIKSCIKKNPIGITVSKDIQKKNVQWIDDLGKELAEIREFESSETGDADNEDDNRSCVCTIL